MNKKNATEILRRYQQGQATDEEKALVEDWLTFGDFPDVDRPEAAIAKDLESIGKRLPLKRRRNAGVVWLRMAAAASVIICICLGGYLLYKPSPSQPVTAAWQNIAPGSSKAVLTLPNGQTIALSSAQTAVVINTANLRYSDGSEVTDAGSPAQPATAYHTIVTPRGGQYQVILQDGTKVWLNAASSLKFPASFDKAGTRTVVLSGEGYFEVAKDAAKPFVVQTPRQSVQVLGTRFNISCYEDETLERTTLLEGAVKVSPASGSHGSVLQPGQQSVVDGNGIRIAACDTEEAVAWKNGKFDFRNQRLEDILRKIARWYDVEVVYEGDIPPVTLYGKLSREKSIGSVLKVLEISGEIKIRLDGRRLIVSKK